MMMMWQKSEMVVSEAQQKIKKIHKKQLTNHNSSAIIGLLTTRRDV